MPDEDSRRSKTRRQAVLVIHGMGEQVPLETMRSFVETVYERDGGVRTGPAESGRRNRVWSIPDTATGSAELRKISTEPRSGDRLRTDFFEFYWADIMQGTPIEAVYEWLRGLILRSPWAVPRSARVWIAWLALWAVSIGLVLSVLATLDPSDGIAEALFKSWQGWLMAQARWFGAALAGAAALWLVLSFLGARNRARVKVTLPVLLIGGGLVLLLAPVATLENVKTWSGLFSLISATVLGGLIAPYLGDVVRYVRATPATVDKRQRVRDRGLALLTALHDKTDGKGPDAPPYYERIIVVAHSLGTIIAYDLIQLYWQKVGPSHQIPAVPALKAPLLEIDRFVADWWGKPESERGDFPLDAFQAQQAAMFAALVAGGVKFRISDFVTMGAALTHAEFLLQDDKAALERAFQERGLSASPPRPDLPSPRASYMLGKSGPFAHFAAPFSAVRWTNIYDLHWFPLLGDIVSGPLQPVFGPGIREHRVTMVREGWLPVLNRLVTHTLYWTWQRRYDGLADDELPAHIKALREALQLRGAAPPD